MHRSNLRLPFVEQGNRYPDHVVQLADIARPVVAAEEFEHILGHHDGRITAGLQGEQILHQLSDVTALAQRRQGHGEAIDAIEKVFAEAAARHFITQTPVGGTHQRKVHRHRLDAPERRDAPLLQDTQQACLQIERHIADLVEKQRSAIGLLDLSHHAFLAGAGKGAAEIAEQL